LPHAVDEGADDLEVDVGLQESDAHLAQGLLDVLVRQAATAAQAVEDRLQTRTEGVQHGIPNYTESLTQQQPEGIAQATKPSEVPPAVPAVPPEGCAASATTRVYFRGDEDVGCRHPSGIRDSGRVYTCGGPGETCPGEA